MGRIHRRSDVPARRKWLSVRLIAMLSVMLVPFGCAVDTNPAEDLSPTPTPILSVPESVPADPRPPTTQAKPTLFAQTASLNPIGHSIYGNDEFVVQWLSLSLRTYNSDGEVVVRNRPLEGWRGDCSGIVMRTSDGRSSFFSIVDHENPAEGINPGSTEVYLTAYGPEFQPQGRVKIWEGRTDSYDGCYDSNLQRGPTTNGISATADHEWVSFTIHVDDEPISGYVAVSTWEVTYVDSRSLSALGDYVVGYDGTCSDCSAPGRLLKVIDPRTKEERTLKIGELGSAGEITRSMLGKDSSSHLLDGANLITTRDGNLLHFNIRNFQVKKVARLDDELKNWVGRVVYDANSQVAIVAGHSAFAIHRDAGKVSASPIWSTGEQYDVCAVGVGTAILSANEQLAELDIVTGDQRSFTDRYSTCPYRVFGSYGWTDEGKVFRILP